MREGLQLSARRVASLLARIFPSIHDAPPFGGPGVPWREVLGDPVPWREVMGPHPEPWREGLSNPVPWRQAYALVIADAHIQEVLALDRTAALFDDAVAKRATERAARLVAEIDELCPRWPRWPKGWPPPPPPPWEREEMTPTELFVFGTRFLAASELAEQGRLQEGLTALGEKALSLSMRG